MKFKSFRTKKGESAAETAEEDGSSAAPLDEIEEEEDAPRERKMPPKAHSQTEEQAPPAQPAVVEEPPYKFGIADRLSRAVDATPNVEEAVKRSPDLVPLSKKFEDMRKRLRQMINKARLYHASMSTLDQDRIELAQELSHFAENSPIANQVSDTEHTHSTSNGGSSPSYLSVYHQVSHQVSKFNDKYEQNVLEYCVEWEAVATRKVDAAQAEIRELRDNYNHYQGKVDNLRKKVNGQESKGKAVNEEMMDKLQRNESKLDEASTKFEAAALPLCCLLEEIVERAWKDLVPLLQSVVIWEADRSHKEAKLFQQLRGLEFVEKQNNSTSSSSGSRKEKKQSKSLSSNSSHSSPNKKRHSSKKYARPPNPEQLPSPETTTTAPSSDATDNSKEGEQDDSNAAAPRKSDSV